MNTDGKGPAKGTSGAARPPGTANGGEETASTGSAARPPGTANGGEETASTGSAPGDEGSRDLFRGFLRRKPRQARAQALVEAVLDAAEEDLERAEHGRLDALFARAGIAAGSFYEYFSSRDGLLGAVVARTTAVNFEELLAEIDRFMAGQKACAVNTPAGRSALEAAIRFGAARVAERYLKDPVKTKLLLTAIARLGLLPTIHRERDRFAEALLVRARALGHRSAPEEVTTFRAIADAVTGIVISELFRDSTPASRTAIAALAGDAAWGIYAARAGLRGSRDPDL
jgi:AcrR family transcriptional regulator